MSDSSSERSLVIFSQVYPPDPTAVGQYLGDVGEALQQQGWRVRVVTADRGYDDPSVRYAPRETGERGEVLRLPWSSTGKGNLALRIAGQLFFLVQAILWGLRHCGSKDRILISTSPPMAAVVALVLRQLRGTPYWLWVMDVNPEQAVALGMAAPGSLPVRLLAWLNRQAIAKAEAVVTLDEDMGQRLEQRNYGFSFPREVIPLWPLKAVEEVNPEENPFVRNHGLEGKLLVLYSGNHSLVHPLTTLLEAARELEDEEKLVFGFVGGGKGKEIVEAYVGEHRLNNCLLLPYQPLDEIGASLSAGAVHVASMGEAMVGLVHPSKCYGAMALGRPLLLLGPAESHFGRLVIDTGMGWQVEHGDVSGMVSVLRSLLDDPEEVRRRGEASRKVLQERYLREKVLPQFCDLFERGTPELAEEGNGFRSGTG